MDITESKLSDKYENKYDTSKISKKINTIFLSMKISYSLIDS